MVRSSWRGQFQTKLNIFKLKIYALVVSSLVTIHRAVMVEALVNCALSGTRPIWTKREKEAKTPQAKPNLSEERPSTSQENYKETITSTTQPTQEILVLYMCCWIFKATQPLF